MFDKHYASWKEFPKDLWRWKNFQISEVACKDGSAMVNERAMDMLQKLRDKIGAPFIVTSAYRSPPHNRAVGGAKKSRHLTAEAFDIRMDNHDPYAFQDAAREIGFNGFGHYPKQGFMHIDARAQSQAAMWNKGGWFPKKRDRFDGSNETDQEAAVEAKGAGIGAVAAAGLVTASAPILTGLGENAQLVLIGGMVVAGISALFLFRRPLARWIYGAEDV